MAGSSYPHIVFAANEQTLPKGELESLLHELFGGEEDGGASTAQGALDVTLTLGGYTFTFWYDDEAEGLGTRYAAFAPPLRQRRIGQCTTMIDLSGEADPQGTHREAAERITQALSRADGVYVFSEESKRFVGLDYDDPFAAEPDPAQAAEPAGEPAAGPAAAEQKAAAEPEASAEPGQETAAIVTPPFAAPAPGAVSGPQEPAPASEPGTGAEPAVPAADGPAAQTDPEPAAAAPEPAPESAQPAGDEPAAPASAPAAEPAPAPEPAPEQGTQGFFRRMFGRRKG